MGEGSVQADSGRSSRWPDDVLDLAPQGNLNKTVFGEIPGADYGALHIKLDDVQSAKKLRRGEAPKEGRALLFVARHHCRFDSRGIGTKGTTFLQRDRGAAEPVLVSTKYNLNNACLQRPTCGGGDGEQTPGTCDIYPADRMKVYGISTPDPQNPTLVLDQDTNAEIKRVQQAQYDEQQKLNERLPIPPPGSRGRLPPSPGAHALGRRRRPRWRRHRRPRWRRRPRRRRCRRRPRLLTSPGWQVLPIRRRRRPSALSGLRRRARRRRRRRRVVPRMPASSTDTRPRSVGSAGAASGTRCEVRDVPRHARRFAFGSDERKGPGPVSPTPFGADSRRRRRRDRHSRHLRRHRRRRRLSGAAIATT